MSSVGTLRFRSAITSFWMSPAGSKEPIVRELDLLEVTRESLLPGLDEAANAITRRFSSLHRSKPSTGGTGTPDSA